MRTRAHDGDSCSKHAGSGIEISAIQTDSRRAGIDQQQRNQRLGERASEEDGDGCISEGKEAGRVRIALIERGSQRDELWLRDVRLEGLLALQPQDEGTAIEPRTGGSGATH